MLFNPLAIILNQNKLIGPNYVDQKRNLNTVLTTKGYKYVFTEKRPDFFIANAPRVNLERYEKWFITDEMTRCYILALMSSILQYQLKDYLNAMI